MGPISNAPFEVPAPPVAPSWLENLEKLTSLKNLKIHQLEHNLRAFPCPTRSTDMRIYRVHDTQPAVTLETSRDPQSGRVLSVKEVCCSPFVYTSRNSTSLTRAPNRIQDDSFKGSSLNMPFWPGGFDSDVSEHLNEPCIDESLFSEQLLQAPPGLPHVSLPNTGDPAEGARRFASIAAGESIESLETLSVQFPAPVLAPKVSKPEEACKGVTRIAGDIVERLTSQTNNEIFNDKAETERGIPPVLKISTIPSLLIQSLPWAESIDVTSSFDNFQDKVPDMAFKFPFELDTFQKHAICKLEEHENVFVAAHTSAGKTVVAEYAIALALRHMTRIIYTSPIKALSNQKFRDFRNNFDSVGLVTGDVQINTSASCLIMTTEILRSMLYNGSDVIRDLEWVVFDEIHYLNNQERGHVWEEVLIMLPHHVSIIMLSATVPNALQFANWVGEIKKRRIFVIATTKRPVPLEHYLYTGSGGASRDQRFLVLDEHGHFLKRGFDLAKEARMSRMSDHKKRFGPTSSQRHGLDENSEKTLYFELVAHLKKKDDLPVVVFTFSRARCDTYARLLSAVDLCTAEQKSEIHQFFCQSLKLLKGTDRELPQVLQIEEMLQQGIGVHHSGILPILKETVELLFQKGLVKLLFATETFAMGVNMPARTVVFDSIRKHDGLQFRSLNAAEYVQMAGRAGRRGLDTTGKVIILCKTGIPDLADLQNIMQGNAAKLESQFRLTYNMILNLLRVERLSVEDFMKRSFMEAGTRGLRADDLREKLDAVTASHSELTAGPTDSQLVQFYAQVKAYLDLRNSLAKVIWENPRTVQELRSGRLVIFEMLPHYNVRVGIILSSGISNVYRILTLTSDLDWVNPRLRNLLISDEPAARALGIPPEVQDRIFQLYLHYGHNTLVDFVPDTFSAFQDQWTVLSVPKDRILEILGNSIYVDGNLVEQYNCPDLPRFRRDQLRPSIVRAAAELQRYTLALVRNEFRPLLFEPLSQMLDLKGISRADLNRVKQLEHMRRSLKYWNYFASYPDFLQKFRRVFLHMALTEEKNRVEYLLSPKSLRLHDEYEARIAVLRKLDYIDSENMVLLKGRVACELGNQNELMVTEMLFNSVFTDCSAVEMAAILSCVVCEAKKVAEPNLKSNERLKKKVAEVKNLARTVGEIQRECGMTESIDAFVEQFRFGLVQVVYDWASGKSFCNIMTLTDAQEGIIVRTIQRLDEILKNLRDATRIIGDPELRARVDEASRIIKRDIVFAASLYTQ